MANRKRVYNDKYINPYILGKYSLVHVKVPYYIRIWYVSNYGSPVILGQNHLARGILEESLVSTNRKTYMNNTVMSDNVWAMAVKNNAVDSHEWLSFVLPEYVVRDGAVVKTDSSWEIYDRDIRTFKRSLETVFWGAVINYVVKMQIKAKEDKKTFKIDWTLETFCAENGISVDYFEQFRRQYYRFLIKCKEEDDGTKELVLAERDKKLKEIGEGVKYQMIKFLDSDY